MPSPPLPTVALAPPPSNLTLSERRAQRQRQRATLPSPLPPTLATPASLLFHSSVQVQVQDPRFLDPPLSFSSGRSGPAYHHDAHKRSRQEDDTASVMSFSHPSGTSGALSPVAAALPRLRNPLPPHYRHPSPAPSLASVSTATSTSTSASSTSTNTSTSSASTSASGHSDSNSNSNHYTYNSASVSHRRRKTITAADDPVLVIGRSHSAATVTPALISPPSTTATTATTATTFSSKDKGTSRGRGRSISRSVRKVASVFNLLKREDVPSVPEFPTGYQSVNPGSITHTKH
jgi:hypothetical protein